jgi:membrane-associated phospholipid phosphatase
MIAMHRNSTLPFTSRSLVVLATALAAITSTSPARAADPDRVEWSPDWPRVRLVEVLDVAALTVGSYAIDSYWTPPAHPSWQGGILFDNAVRDALRGRTLGAQQTASDISDHLYQLGVLTPYVVDVFFVDLSVHQNADVAIQMLLINMQSLGLTGVLSLGAEHLVGRARPYVQDCGPGGVVRDASGQPLLNSCGTAEDFQSFYSGHSAAVATMAGLTCAHHQHLPLYGGGVADLLPCLVMIGAAVSTGVTRVIADRHWASDVVTGWSVGAFSGYVLPSLLHYGFTSGHAVGEMNIAGAHVLPVPVLYAGGAGLAFAGAY